MKTMLGGRTAETSVVAGRPAHPVSAKPTETRRSTRERNRVTAGGFKRGTTQSEFTGTSGGVERFSAADFTNRLVVKVTLGPAVLGTSLHTIKSKHLISCESNAHQRNEILLAK
jgi:hypothetical protein